MRKETFKRETDESLIILQCHFPNHGIALAFDTGASHTTIALTQLARVEPLRWVTRASCRECFVSGIFF